MERKLETISFAAHEAAMFRKERIIKRLIETIVVSEMIISTLPQIRMRIRNDLYLIGRN